MSNPRFDPINFLRSPDPPRVSQHAANQPITQGELVELWSKVGVIQKAQRDTRISRSDFYGLLCLVAMLAFCLGYWMGYQPPIHPPWLERYLGY